MPETAEVKKSKKLAKAIEGNVVTIIEAISGRKLVFDFTTLPKPIQEKLGPFGLGHKLGDAAAGKSGEEAVSSIQHVWDGIKKGDWSTRAPAGVKIDKKALEEKVKGLPPAEAAIAAALLKKLGIIL
jgi:hypothetical protein